MFITVEPIEFGQGIKLFTDQAVFDQFRLVKEELLNQQGTLLQYWLKN